MISVTPQQFATYLTDGFYDEWGYPARQFSVSAGDSLTVNLTALPAQVAAIARLALDGWQVASGLRFFETTSTDAQIVLRQDAPGQTGLYAYAEVTQSYDDYSITQSVVHVSSAWATTYGVRPDSYYMQTWVHEIGHALGLGHAGLYNGSASFATDANFQQDSWHATVMSYFSQAENNFTSASYAYAVTPRIVDVLAMQRLYGEAPVDAHDTVFGWNSNATGLFGQVSRMLQASSTLAPVAVTLVDHGGHDRLDLSGDARDQRIDLRQGLDSDVLGLRGNISIAFGTEIEDVRAGSGHDDVTGNYLGNLIEGNAGNDLLRGLGGGDDLRGGTGHDTLTGDEGDDRLLGADGDDAITGGDGGDWIAGGSGTDRLDGGTGNDSMSGGDAGDRLRGEAGNDLVHGNDGDDTVNAGAGHDVATGGNGRDVIQGAAGADRLSGGADGDRLAGNGGDDRLTGDAGNDVLLGGAGHDTLTGGTGDDTLRGGTEDDLLRGIAGRNLIEGGNGDDIIIGGTGADRIVAGAGADRLIGGAGADVFVFHGAIDSPFDGARDRITDFQIGIDLIDLSAMTPAYLGSGRFSGAGEAEVIHFQRGATHCVATDVDGDGQGDLMVLLTGLTTLGADDFII